MRIDPAGAPVERELPPDSGEGAVEVLRLSDAGGLTQFGAYVVTLHPGAQSSDRHWHEREDEFLLMLSGEAVLVEDDGANPLGPGDAVAWPAGVANAHHVVNRSGAACSFLIVGTRVGPDVCHYPDLGRRLVTGETDWRIETDGGAFIRGGTL